ncbi:MAG: hypothetical protein Q9192_002545 [Flavoplaca navasiana]
MNNTGATIPSPFERQEDDSDWEYEYDDVETESFYVTVDVSSASQQSRAPKITESLFSTNPKSQNHDGQAKPSTSIPIDPTLQDPSPTSQISPEKLQDQGPQERMQILDLHTRNPLISYHDRIYSCNWASTIGTDLFLASPESLSAAQVDGKTVTPIYDSPNVSIIGTSCINLAAKPVTITARTNASRPQPSPPNTTTEAEPSQKSPNPEAPPLSPIINPAQSSAQSPPNQPQPPKIPVSDTADHNSRAQASFLESLIAIKASKGETDQVTVHATKQNHGTGWRVQRRLAEEEQLAGQLGVLSNSDESNSNDEEDAEAMDLTYPDLPSMRSAGANTITGAAESGQDIQPATRTSPKKVGRSRGSRGRSRGTARAARSSKTRSRRKGVKAGGLFRDYVPGVENTTGANNRSEGVDSTPDRWEEVEGQVRRVDGGDAGVGMAEGERDGGDEDVRMEDVG